MKQTILIACKEHWLTSNDFDQLEQTFEIVIVRKKEELSLKFLAELKPTYVIIAHWSWKISQEIINLYQPIMFHTAPLPFGRGGSPIQNLILSGYNESPVWALLMSEEMDAGDLIMSRTISLEGSLREIFLRVRGAVVDMINVICEEAWKAVPQKGTEHIFKRLKYSDNQIPENISLEQFYDRIRMVDADGYPNSYVNFGNFIIEFKDSTLEGDELFAKVKITRNEQ